MTITHFTGQWTINHLICAWYIHYSLHGTSKRNILQTMDPRVALNKINIRHGNYICTCIYNVHTYFICNIFLIVYSHILIRISVKCRAYMFVWVYACLCVRVRVCVSVDITFTRDKPAEIRRGLKFTCTT